MEFQTRADSGELRFFSTLADALDYAKENKRVWKISFSLPTGERIRLCRDKQDGSWCYSPLLGMPGYNDESLEVSNGAKPC